MAIILAQTQSSIEGSACRCGGRVENYNVPIPPRGRSIVHRLTAGPTGRASSSSPLAPG